jgi:HSP20 family protein
MEREMQMLTDEAFRGLFAMPVGASGRFWQPAVDIHETDDLLIVKMELAGARADDLQVTLAPDDRVLVVSGTRSELGADRDGRTRCHQLEIYFGPFERAIALPSDVDVDRDRISAVYRDGFLQVTIPKKPERQERRKIVPITDSETLEFTEEAVMESKTVIKGRSESEGV